MTTSGTTAFNLDFAEIAEEAFERAGRELRTGYDLRTARRSFNLMTIEFQNRGLNMWTFDEGTITHKATYCLSVGFPAKGLPVGLLVHEGRTLFYP